jgi:rhodanese-related sulfurtransferase
MVVLVLAAVVCAGISNLAASRERKLPWVGSYPRALVTEPVTSAAQTPSAATARPAAPAEGSPQTAPSSPAASDASARFPPHPDQASVEIGTGDSEALFREGRLFLDARRTSVYADGHVRGARSFPVWESDIDSRVKALYEEGLDQNAPIVIYCSGGDCEDSHMLAQKLYMVGFNDLLVDRDGFPAWEKRGLPITKGDKP